MRREWKKVVTAVVQGHAVGEPFEDVLFHGTTVDRARSILANGFQRNDGRSFWAAPDIAGIYANGRAATDGSEPCLIAIRLRDLPEAERWYDEGAIDMPVGRSYRDVREIWLDMGQWKGGWKAGLAASGCIEFLGEVPVDKVIAVITDMDSALAFIEGRNLAPAPDMDVAQLPGIR